MPKGLKGFQKGNRLNDNKIYPVGKDHPSWRGGKDKVICRICGKLFYEWISQGKRNCCSRKCKGIYHSEYIVGKNHPNWKGGITPENVKIRTGIQTKLWRGAVFARDNWTCQKCKIKGMYLNAHHIQNFTQFPELRFAIDNGIVLCKNCHKLFHKKYGKQNNTREQIEEFTKDSL